MNDTPDNRTQKPVLRPAATVLLVREVRASVEVLIIRRHENLAFMGGLWVFPGGTLSPTDTSDRALARVPAQSQARCAQFADLHGAPLQQRQCLGLAVAAYRETFEETGILMATTVEGAHCTDELLARAQERRRAIVSQPELFATLLEEEELLLDVDRLTYWAHWITPSYAPRRFDTRFFIARVPHEQTATIDTVETVDQAWMSAAAIIQAADTHKMPVSQPTLYNLMQLDAGLRERGSLDALLSSVARQRIAPVLPKMIRGSETTMVLPWDPQYSQLDGEGAPPHLEYPHALLALPSRMTMKKL